MRDVRSRESDSPPPACARRQRPAFIPIRTQLRVVVLSFSAVFRFAVFAFFALRLFYYVSRFSSAVLANTPFSEILFSISRAALRYPEFVD